VSTNFAAECRLELKIEPKLEPDKESAGTDHFLTGTSNCSSTWSSMKRIKEQAKQRLSWSWKTRSQITPTRSVRESWMATFGSTSPVSAIVEGLEPTFSSDLHVPCKSEQLDCGPDHSLRFKLGLTMRTLKNIHEAIEHFLLRK